MKRKILLTTLVINFITVVSFVAGGARVQATPLESLNTFAATCVPTDGLPANIFVPWYKYISDQDGSRCRINTTDLEPQTVAVLIAAAVVELFINIAGIVAIVFFLYGTFQYLMSQGEPQSLSNARSTMINSLIGFAIVVMAIALVQFLGRTIS